MVPINHALTIAHLFLSQAKPAGLGSKSNRKKGDQHYDERGSAVRAAYAYIKKAESRLSDSPDAVEEKVIRNIKKIRIQLVKSEFDHLQRKWAMKKELHSFYFLSESFGERNARALIRRLIHFLRDQGLELNSTVKTWEKRIAFNMRQYLNKPIESMESVFTQKEREFIARAKDSGIVRVERPHFEKISKDQKGVLNDLFREAKSLSINIIDRLNSHLESTK